MRIAQRRLVVPVVPGVQLFRQDCYWEPKNWEE